MSRPPGREIAIHKLLLGTHAYGEEEAPKEPNYLMIGEVSLPLPEATIDARLYDDEKQEVVSLILTTDLPTFVYVQMF